MNSQQEINNNIFDNHPIKTFFHTENIGCAGGKMILNLRVRDEFSRESFGSGGILGLVSDYAARTVGQGSIGCCFVLEHEINVHSPLLSAALTARVRIESITDQNAAFCCKIFSVKNFKNRLVAESHGTLVASN